MLVGRGEQGNERDAEKKTQDGGIQFLLAVPSY